MIGNKVITLKRLEKEQQSIYKDPIPGVLVKRDGTLDFHFVIYNLEGEYKGGYYHGLLQLHENYPFAAPKLFFYTPSGRFQINMPICTSFTNYHQQSWTSAWNVRSLLLGTVSFMTSDQASYGCRNDSMQVKKHFAEKSLQFNLKNPKFCSLFNQDLIKMGVTLQQIGLQLQGTQIKDKVMGPTTTALQNDAQNQLLPPVNQQRQNGNKCKKIIVACGLAIAVITVTCYLIFK